MSAHPSYSTDFQHSTHFQPQQNTFNQEFKSSYDDLIDDYAAPYAANSRHQTFTVATPPMNAPEHRRGPSYPLSPSYPSASAKHSEDITEQSPVAYPPHHHSVKEIDTRPFWRKILPDSLACRLYLITVLVETTINLAIEGELLIIVREDAERTGTDSNKMPVYLSVFALAHVFQFIMALDAVHAQNTLQFISLAVFNWVLFGYSIIQIFEVREAISSNAEGVSSIPVQVLTTTIPGVAAVAGFIYMGLAYKIYHEFGWKVYKFLGADRRIKKMYANYQIYECLVKFDVFFWAGFSIQFIWLVLRTTDWEYYVTCAALPLSLVLLVEGHLAARHENKWMMATFMSGCVGAMVYFVYKLVKVLMYKDEEYKPIWKTLLVFSVIAIVLLFVTFIYSILVLQSFGRGLKDSLTRKSVEHKRQASQNPHRRAASANPNRMTID